MAGGDWRNTSWLENSFINTYCRWANIADYVAYWEKKEKTHQNLIGLNKKSGAAPSIFSLIYATINKYD